MARLDLTVVNSPNSFSTEQWVEGTIVPDTFHNSDRPDEITREDALEMVKQLCEQFDINPVKKTVTVTEFE